MFRFRPPLTPEVSQTDHLRAPLFKSRNPLSRPALRGGVIWPGSACDPRLLSCTKIVPSVHIGMISISLTSPQAKSSLMFCCTGLRQKAVCLPTAAHIRIERPCRGSSTQPRRMAHSGSQGQAAGMQLVPPLSLYCVLIFDMLVLGSVYELRKVVTGHDDCSWRCQSSLSTPKIKSICGNYRPVT